jgi:hypothetical protein
MIKSSLFADQEREAMLNKLGDARQVMEQEQHDDLRRSTLRHRAAAASAAAVCLSTPN